MDELIDASPLIGDPERLRKQLAQDGYLFFRGLLPVADVNDCPRRRRAGPRRQPGGSPQDPPRSARCPPGRPCVRAARATSTPTPGSSGCRRFHELAHHPALIAVMDDIIGEPLLVHPRKIARTSLPQDDEYTPPHQDFRLIQGTVDTLDLLDPAR